MSIRNDSYGHKLHEFYLVKSITKRANYNGSDQYTVMEKLTQEASKYILNMNHVEKFEQTEKAEFNSPKSTLQ